MVRGTGIVLAVLLAGQGCDRIAAFVGGPASDGRASRDAGDAPHDAPGDQSFDGPADGPIDGPHDSTVDRRKDGRSLEAIVAPARLTFCSQSGPQTLTTDLANPHAFWLAIDAIGNPHLFYMLSASATLAERTRDVGKKSNGLTNQVVNPGVLFASGDKIAAAFDTSDNLYLVIGNMGGGHIRVRPAGGSWISSGVATPAPALAVGVSQRAATLHAVIVGGMSLRRGHITLSNAAASTCGSQAVTGIVPDRERVVSTGAGYAVSESSATVSQVLAFSASCTVVGSDTTKSNGSAAPLVIGNELFLFYAGPYLTQHRRAASNLASLDSPVTIAQTNTVEPGAVAAATGIGAALRVVYVPTSHTQLRWAVHAPGGVDAGAAWLDSPLSAPGPPSARVHARISRGLMHVLYNASLTLFYQCIEL